MNQEPKTTNERTAKKTKKQRKMSDLAPKKDVRGGEEISFNFGSTKPTYQH